MGQRCSARDRAEQLFTLYEQKMYVIAYSILHDSWQAEDAVSEAFVKIIANMEKIRDPESDRTKRFVIRVIRNTSIDLYRKNQRERNTFTVLSGEARQPECEADPMDRLLGRLHSQTAVDRLLGTLPEAYREVVECRCLRELTVKETAEVLGISEAAVRKRYERARKILLEQRKGGQADGRFKVI